MNFVRVIGAMALAGLGLVACASVPEDAGDIAAESTGAATEPLTVGGSILIGPGISVANPEMLYQGLSFGAWTSDYMTWRHELPLAGHPGNTGDCSVGNNGRVWFLANESPTDPLVKNCTLPRGTSLYVPIGGGWCSSAEGDHEPSNSRLYGTNLSEIRQCASQWEIASPLVTSDVRIDGYQVRNPDQYLHFSTPFHFHLPPHGILGDEVAEGDYVGQFYGRFIMIQPLRPGNHTLKTRIVYGDGFSRTTTYNLTVNP